MKSESDFRVHVTRQADKLGAHVSNIESHQTSAGIPDCNFYLLGTDLWLELKVIKGGQIRMRPTQKRWHLDRHEAGGKSWVLVLDPETQYILVVPGHVAALLGVPEGAWRAVAEFSNALNIPALLTYLAQRTKDGHSQQSPDRNRPPQGAGSPPTALPPSGENLGGHHWLTGKP